MSTVKFSNIWLKIKQLFLKYEQKIVIIIGFCLISAISYQFGILQGEKWQQKPLIIEKPVETSLAVQSDQNELSVAPGDKAANSLPVPISSNNNSANCPYVGSKSSTKFYLATCSWAKRIKPENMVCFKSAEQAIGQGRTESKCAK